MDESSREDDAVRAASSGAPLFLEGPITFPPRTRCGVGAERFGGRALLERLGKGEGGGEEG